MFDSLKNFFGGKKQSDGSEQQRPEAQPANTPQKTPARFTLMAERVVPDAGERFYAEGELFGEAAVGERITVLHRDGNISHPVVEAMQGGGANTKLFFSGKEGLSLDWTYALITNIPYQIEVDVNRPIENPYLLGLTRVVFRFQQEGDFLNLFFRELVRSHYLLAVRTDGSLPEGSGTVTLKKGMQFGIARVTLDQGEEALPVYTDWDAIRLMEAQGANGWKRETMVLHFPQLVGMLRENEGFVINPYGPQLFYVSPDIIRSIQNSPGYQSEFGEAKMQSKTVERDSKMMLGYPVENEEVTALKSALLAYAKSRREIAMLDLLLKSDEDGTQSYLIILDVPEENCRAYFQEIYNACRHLLHRVCYMDFVTLRRAGFADGVRIEPTLYVREKES